MAKRNKKTEDKGFLAVIKFQLGAGLNMTTVEMKKNLNEMAVEQNHAINAMLRHWERRAENYFGRKEQVHCKGLPNGRCYVDKKTKKVKQSKPTPARDFEILVMPEKMADHCPPELIGNLIATELYRAGQAAAPRLSADILASLSNSLMERFLLKDMPPDHKGKAKRMWQAVLWNEASRPCVRQLGLELPKKRLKVSYGLDHAVIEFPVWGRGSGREDLTVRARLRLSGWRKMKHGYKKTYVPRGMREILRKVVSGEDKWELSDSRLVWKEDKETVHGKWFLHLCYHRPPDELILDLSRQATLYALGGDSTRPFEISCDDCFTWQLGDVAVMETKQRHLKQRLTAMKYGYRHAGTGPKGHGRKRFDSKVRVVTSQQRKVVTLFTQRLVAEIVRYCQRNNCGTLQWRTPGTYAKENSWLKKKDLPFGWAVFQSKLEYACRRANIRILNVGYALKPASDKQVAYAPSAARST